MCRAGGNGGSGPSGPSAPSGGRKDDYAVIVNQQCFAEGRLRALAGDRDGAADAFVAALEVRDLTPRHQVDAGSTDHMLYTLLDRVGGCPNTNPPPDTPEGAFTNKEFHQSGPNLEFPYDAATTRHNMCNGMENKPDLYSKRRKKTSLTPKMRRVHGRTRFACPRACPPSLTITGNPELKHGLAADRRRPSASKVGGEFGRATEMLDAQPALCRVLPCKGKIDDEDATVCLFSVAQDTLVQIFELAASDAAEGRPARKAGARAKSAQHEAYPDCLDEAQVITALARALVRYYRSKGQYK